MKVKLFTHTDLDGIGCAIVGKLAFGDIDIEYCNYDNIDKKVEKFFFSNKALQYDNVFITDISIKNELAKEIDICIKGTSCIPKIQLLDHHKTALYLNDYDWAYVVEEDKLLWLDADDLLHKTSGTYLLLEHFNNAEFEFNNIEQLGQAANLSYFVETVRRYDTWEWTNIYNDILPKQWNNLFYLLGRDRFIENVLEKINTRMEFSKSDLLMLELEQERIEHYIKSKDKELLQIEVGGNKTGVVFGEKYHSELGNELCKLHPELDYISIVNLSKAVSYRSIGDFDVSEVATVFGGGGHKNASGSPISDEIRKNVLSLLFSINL